MFLTLTLTYRLTVSPKVYIVRFSYPSFELARWRNSVHSASRVTLVRVYAGHAAGRDLGAAAGLRYSYDPSEDTINQKWRVFQTEFHTT